MIKDIKRLGSILVYGLLSCQSLMAFFLWPNYDFANLKSLITPPSSASIETWQLACRNARSSSDLEHPTPTYTDNIKVAIDGNDIYIGNLPGDFPIDDPIIWIKGRIDGDKVIFLSGQEVFEVDAKLNAKEDEYTRYNYKFYTTDVKSEWITTEHVHGTPDGYMINTLTFLEDAWTLNYDAEHKIMTECNLPCVFSPETGVEQYSDEFRAPYPGRIINQVYMGKVDETAYIPTMPQRFILTGEKRTILRVYTQPVSPAGIMLNPKNLHYQVFVDGDLHRNQGINNENWKGYSYAEKAIYSDVTLPLDKDFEECYARMAYVDGDNIYYSDILYLGQSDIRDIEQDIPDDADTEIYDLMGRRCNAEHLSPGIYIKNGKKFVVTN